jgi:hypothetical protein
VQCDATARKASRRSAGKPGGGTIPTRSCLTRPGGCPSPTSTRRPSLDMPCRVRYRRHRTRRNWQTGDEPFGGGGRGVGATHVGRLVDGEDTVEDWSRPRSGARVLVSHWTFRYSFMSLRRSYGGRSNASSLVAPVQPNGHRTETTARRGLAEIDFGDRQRIDSAQSSYPIRYAWAPP